jgi:hypothetical protein
VKNKKRMKKEKEKKKEKKESDSNIVTHRFLQHTRGNAQGIEEYKEITA